MYDGKPREQIGYLQTIPNPCSTECCKMLAVVGKHVVDIGARVFPAFFINTKGPMSSCLLRMSFCIGSHANFIFLKVKYYLRISKLYFSSLILLCFNYPKSLSIFGNNYPMVIVKEPMKNHVITNF